MAELRHPNTVRVLDYGVTPDGLWFYAMELLEGETLATLVARRGRLPPARAVTLGLQAARALAEAHAAWIVHRDIKPENLFVARMGGEEDVIKVLDFGIVKVVSGERPETLTQEGNTLGTPLFMSPEQVAGRDVDARSDLYSLGATLYFALTGRPPFEAPLVSALLMAHLSKMPARPSELVPGGLSPALETVVLRCLEKAPEDRHASAAALAEALAATMTELDERDGPGPESVHRREVAWEAANAATEEIADPPEGDPRRTLDT
jgi:serine/threonine-protein kinase